MVNCRLHLPIVLLCFCFLIRLVELRTWLSVLEVELDIPEICNGGRRVLHNMPQCFHSTVSTCLRGVDQADSMLEDTSK